MTNESKGSIKVRFGDLFSTPYSREKKFVVIDTRGGEFGNGLCSASQVFFKEGKEALGIPGTTSRRDILEILGSWDLVRIVHAFMNYYSDSLTEGSFYDAIRDASKRGPTELGQE